jgi:hypothetical protein
MDRDFLGGSRFEGYDMREFLISALYYDDEQQTRVREREHLSPVGWRHRRMAGFCAYYARKGYYEDYDHTCA